MPAWALLALGVEVADAHAGDDAPPVAQGMRPPRAGLSVAGWGLPHFRPTEAEAAPAGAAIYLIRLMLLVGGTGFEPVTPAV